MIPEQKRRSAWSRRIASAIVSYRNVGTIGDADIRVGIQRRHLLRHYCA
jgi:hypothetical protein